MMSGVAAAVVMGHYKMCETYFNKNRITWGQGEIQRTYV